MQQLVWLGHMTPDRLDRMSLHSAQQSHILCLPDKSCGGSGVCQGRHTLTESSEERRNTVKQGRERLNGRLCSTRIDVPLQAPWPNRPTSNLTACDISIAETCYGMLRFRKQYGSENDLERESSEGDYCNALRANFCQWSVPRPRKQFFWGCQSRICHGATETHDPSSGILAYCRTLRSDNPGTSRE